MVKAFSKEVKLEVLMGDVTSTSFVDELIIYCLSTSGQLNYAVNAVGIAGVSIGTDEMELEEYRRIQDVNVKSMWLCEQAEIRAMLEQELVNG